MLNSQHLLTKYKDSVKDNIAIVSHARRGVDATSFYDLALITGLNKNRLAEDIFQVSVKTFNRYKEDKKKLNPRNSELILKLMVLYQKGIDIFGHLKGFNSWLQKPAFGLGKQTPYDIMNTATGIDLIIEELVRIEYGDLA